MPYRKLFSTLVCLVLLLFPFIDGTSWAAEPWSPFLRALPATVPVARGGSGSTTIVAHCFGDCSTATLSVSGLPSGVTASFTPVAPSSKSWTLTLHAASDTVDGSYPITVILGGMEVVVTVDVSADLKLLDNSFEAEEEWSYSQPTGTSARWAIVGSGTVPESSPRGGEAMANFNSYSSAPGDQALYRLRTAFAIPAGVSTATLKFWMYHDTFKSSNDSVRACVSTDGANYTAVGPTVPRYDGSAGWAEVSVDLSGYRGQSNVTIGFLGASEHGNDIYLDDVTVIAEAMSSAGMTVTAQPPTVTVVQGTSVDTWIITTVYGGYNSALSLTASGLPSGVTATFDAATIAAPGNGSATVTFTASDSAPLGSYPVTISCVGGGANAQVTVTLTVTSTFSLIASASYTTVTSKTPATVTLSTKGTGGFNSPVDLSVWGLPRGVTATITPATIAAPRSGAATVTFTAEESAPWGGNNLTLSASGGGVTQRVAMYLAVFPDTTYSLTVSPASLSIGQHGTKKGTVTSTLATVYNNSVTLAVSGLPPDVTGTLSPAFIPVPGSGVATITFTAGAAAVPGTYPITFTSAITAPGQLTRQAEMNLTVFAAGPPHFSIPEKGTFESFSELYSTLSEGSHSYAYARDRVVAKGPIFEKELSLTLNGGYDSTFTSVDGASVIEGPLILRRGKLTLERFIIR